MHTAVCGRERVLLVLFRGSAGKIGNYRPHICVEFVVNIYLRCVRGGHVPVVVRCACCTCRRFVVYLRRARPFCCALRQSLVCVVLYIVFFVFLPVLLLLWVVRLVGVLVLCACTCACFSGLAAMKNYGVR